MLEFGLAIVIAGLLLAHQDAVATLLYTFVQKTSGAPGLETVALVVSTTRSVVRGVIGSALVQAVVCTCAYVVTGVPGWPVLGALTCFASIIQIGPMLVWLPVALWLWMQQASRGRLPRGQDAVDLHSPIPAMRWPSRSAMTQPATTMRAVRDSARRFWPRSNAPWRQSWRILKPRRW